MSLKDNFFCAINICCYAIAFLFFISLLWSITDAATECHKKNGILFVGDGSMRCVREANK